MIFSTLSLMLLMSCLYRSGQESFIRYIDVLTLRLLSR